MRLRKLNHAGINGFAHYLAGLYEAPDQPIPMNLLTDLAFSNDYEIDIDIDNPGFESRYQLGRYLVERLSGFDQNAIAADAGLWAWLGLLYFADLCPEDADGNRRPAASNNYILSAQQKDFHRHAVRTTYMLVRQHGENVQYMLSNPLSKRGELTEQLTGRSYFMSCEGIMTAAKLLYADPDRDTWKRGAATKKPGAVRRFGIVVRQFELTYDLFSLTGNQIVSMLPREFDGFRQQIA